MRKRKNPNKVDRPKKKQKIEKGDDKKKEKKHCIICDVYVFNLKSHEKSDRHCKKVREQH